VEGWAAAEGIERGGRGTGRIGGGVHVRSGRRLSVRSGGGETHEYQAYRIVWDLP